MLDKHLYFPASKKNDLEFGIKQEEQILPRLIKYFGQHLVKTNNTYGEIDFTGATISMELKSRRIPHNKYDTALVGANKIEKARADPSRDYYIVWNYTDGLYYLKYTPSLWDTFEVADYQRGQRTDCHDAPKRTYLVPYRHLKKIEV